MCFNPQASLYLIYKIGIFFYPREVAEECYSSWLSDAHLLARQRIAVNKPRTGAFASAWEEREGRAEPALSLSDAQTERDSCIWT